MPANAVFPLAFRYLRRKSCETFDAALMKLFDLRRDYDFNLGRNAIATAIHTAGTAILCGTSLPEIETSTKRAAESPRLA
jgi:hypothetical protein